MEKDKIKRAVKDALDDKKLTDLAVKMNDLSTQMATGFSAVHTRLDIVNGKTAINSTDIVKLKEKEDGGKKYLQLMWLILTTLVGVVVYLATKV